MLTTRGNGKNCAATAGERQRSLTTAKARLCTVPRTSRWKAKRYKLRETLSTELYHAMAHDVRMDFFFLFSTFRSQARCSSEHFSAPPWSPMYPNSTNSADPDIDDPVNVYQGASSGTVPYTSSIPAPTVTGQIITTTNAVADGYTAAPSEALSSSSQSAADETSSAGAAKVIGAIGAAALFGGAAFLAQM